MPALGITGGIATGKSTFSHALCRHLSGKLFDTDQYSRELLAHDAAVRTEVVDVFGARAFQPDGTPDRSWLREAIFADVAKRHALEQILHPRIRARWTSWIAAARLQDVWACVDIPLLYETNAQEHFAAVVVVACSPATQRARLLQNRRLSATTADRIIAAQLDPATKIAQADHLIWNDSTIPCLDRQAGLLAGALRQHHGRS